MGERVIIPKELRARVLKELHIGHPGIVRMKKLARSYVYWPNIDDDCQNMVRNCSKCQEYAKNPIKVPLESWPTPSRAWQRIHVDFVTDYRRAATERGNVWKAPHFTWKQGVVAERLGKVNYEVVVEGRLMRKHANQLRHSNTTASWKCEDNSLKTLLDVVELDDNRLRSSDKVASDLDVNTAIPCSPEPSLRRSTRIRRPVKRYGIDV
ncbi:hypothetical protein COOONC_10124 [Cooperia oncophora]